MCNLAFYRMKYKNQNSTLPARAYPNTPLFESALNIAGALCAITLCSRKTTFEDAEKRVKLPMDLDGFSGRKLCNN